MIEEQLKGTAWSLITFQSEDKNGEINYPLGNDAKGYITFTDKSILSVQLMAADRNKEVPTDVIENMNTTVEEEMTRLGYHAYSGPFTIDEDEAVLTTNVQLSLIPDYIGSKQKRAAKIEGENLYLSNVDHPERKLVWERVKK